MTAPERPDVSTSAAISPCPRCAAHWTSTEIMGAARRGGGYHLRCNECGHGWDDPNASHGQRETEHRRIRERMTFMRTRQDIAYKAAPTGSWLQRWVPGVCRHDGAIRCTHGDEIIGRGFRRRVCMVCGRALKGPLPDECFFTGELHPSASSNGRTSDS